MMHFLPLRQLCRMAASRARAFLRAEKGNVAMIFSLALIPMAIAAGAGVDLARALIVRSQISEALDAAGLAVGATSGLSQSEVTSLAQSYFNANYKLDNSYGAPPTVTVVKDSNSVTLSASVDMPTVLMKVAGVKDMDIGFSSQVVWGTAKLWVSLVLDNTGSMQETDSTGTSKIDALKTAAHQLLTMLQNASSNPGDVKVSVVPFNRDVNIGASSYNAAWLDWTDWDVANTTTTYTACHGGSGGSGRYTWYTGGSGSGSDGSYSWGSSGYSDRSNCTATTVTADHNTWNGCITDRTQSYDTLNTTPSATDPNTLFPTDQYDSCPTQIQPLTDDWSALSDIVDSMYASGNTNQTIGLAWGWQTLTDGDPMNAGSLPQGTERVIILLSDGLNTQNRWTTHQSSIDAREELACDNAKADGVTIYTIFVDLNGTSGNSAALQYCASDSSKYYDLTTSGQIVAAFNTIGNAITNLRVAK